MTTKTKPIPGPDFLSGATAVADPPAAGEPLHQAEAEEPVAAELTHGEKLKAHLSAAEADKEQARRDDEADAWSHYRRLLMKDEPSVTDLEDLRGVCLDLSVTPEQAGEDRRIVEEARRQLAFYAAREENSRAVSEARTVVLGLRKRFASEEELARKALQKAEGPAALSYDARDRLCKLARRRPELFDSSVDPPRLREAE